MKFCEDCEKIFGVMNDLVILVDTPVAGQHNPPTKSLDYSWFSVALAFGIGMTLLTILALTRAVITDRKTVPGPRADRFGL